MYLVTDPEAPRARKLCSGRFDPYSFRWSAGGDQIVAALGLGSRPTPQWRLAIVDPRTGKITPLSDRQGQPVYGLKPQWVADDERIAYLSSRSARSAEIWAYVVATRDTERLFPFASHLE